MNQKTAGEDLLEHLIDEASPDARLIGHALYSIANAIDGFTQAYKASDIIESDTPPDSYMDGSPIAGH